MIQKTWNLISPFWPIKNLVASNPLWGFVDKHFEEVILKDAHIFSIPELPQNIQDLNLHSIKYLQAFFDNSQSVIKMPNKKNGLLNSCKNLMPFDRILIKDKNLKHFIKSLPNNAQGLI
jgi:uncharacterized protein YbcC (UPF0753/DUF2309 family)